jgi:UDP-N-acetylglucosamine 2-epimerase (non-hydrolysing)
MKIACIVGARPNFVKIAPILAELRAYPGVIATLIHTGQHYDMEMSGSFFSNLEMPAPDVNLGVGSGSAVVQLAEIMQRLEPVLLDMRPEMVVVVGDVNSTLAGALTAVKLGVRIAHVEAGLRSFDRSMPEEINRILTDGISDLLFTTEPSANDNLTREGIPPERIHWVGNVMIDTLFHYRDRARQSRILEKLALSAGSYVALTLHRPSNVDDQETLLRLLEVMTRIQSEIPVVFPVHPRTRQRLEELDGRAPDTRGLRLTDPLPYLDFLQLMANAHCVLTDSGGIQEETTALGIPCLTLRNNTERPITVTQGTNRVIGVDPEKIHSAWEELQRGRWPKGRLPDLWDGRASQRLVNIILDYLRSKHSGVGRASSYQ